MLEQSVAVWPEKRLWRISSHGKEEIWFVEVSTKGHSIMEQLGYKHRTPHMRREKNEFVFQKPNIFSIMPIIHSSIL